MKKVAKAPSNLEKEEQAVATYLAKQSTYPLFNELQALRIIIKAADKKIKERIKWNAPSYYTNDDLVTFNLRDQKKLLLVLHHPSVVTIQSSLLTGSYPDRRLIYFTSLEDVNSSKKELTFILKKLVKNAT